MRHWAAGTTKDVPFACREAIAISSDPRGGAIVSCWDGRAGEAATYRVTDGGPVPFVAETWPISPVTLSPDGRQAVLARRGACKPPAPVCDFSYVLRDLGTGKERGLLPDGYYLGASIWWSALGLTYVQPECADAGCAGIGDRGGTFVWNGTAWDRESALRFVAAAGPYRVYERGRQSNRADASVVLSGPAGDVDLTPSGLHERALSLNASGEVLVARGGSSVVRYDAHRGVLWRAEIPGDGIRGVTDRYVVAPSYNAVGVPAFAVYDLDRMLRFDVSLGDVRVWTASLR